MIDIDWWSLIREARIEAWHHLIVIFKIVCNHLIQMLSSGDTLLIVLALIVITGTIATSSTALLRLLLRLTRNGASTI